MNWLANYMARREHLDIAEVGREINAARRGEAPEPMRAKPRQAQPSAKKTGGASKSGRARK
jgi:hypothetical protein